MVESAVLAKQYNKRTVLLFICQVMSNSLQSHGQQNARPPCSSPSPEVRPSLCPLHWWCYPAILSSDALFSFSLSHHQGLSQSVIPTSTWGWFPLRLTGLTSFLSKGLSGFFSSTTVRRHQFFGILPSLRSSSHNRTWPWKTIALAIWTFVGRVKSLLFNTLRRFAIAFLSRINCLWFHGCSHRPLWFWSPGKGNLSLLPHSPLLFSMKQWGGCHDLIFFSI